MGDSRAIIEQAYAAFNQRDIDGAVALMAPDVSWPKASEGGRVVGRDEVRAYWTRQWSAFNPQVWPLELLPVRENQIRVRVRQLVKDLHGDVLSGSEVWHVYTIAEGLIMRMDLGDDENDSTREPSAAFASASNRSR